MGFLTAAYLAWFRQLGYSWVLQHHLDPIRNQIRHPETNMLSGYVAKVKGENFPRLQIGVAYLDMQLVLTAYLGDYIVLLPSVSDPELYSRITGTDSTVTKIKNPESMNFTPYRQSVLSMTS